MEIDPIHRSIFVKIDRKAVRSVKQVRPRRIPRDEVCILYSSEGDDDVSTKSALSNVKSSDDVTVTSLTSASTKSYNSDSPGTPCKRRKESIRTRRARLFESNKYRNIDCGGERSYYVKIFVQNDYIFIVKREILELTSRIIKRMLQKQSKEREITSLHFYEIRPDVMKEFCIYAIYSYEFRYRWKPKYWLHEDTNNPIFDVKATKKKIGKEWDYEFPKHLTYDLYMMANFLMC